MPNIYTLPSESGIAQLSIISFIHSATSSINVAMYNLNHKKIIKALIKAHKRGVEVTICLDKSNTCKNSAAITKLSKAGIPLLVPAEKMHCKFMIVDNRRVIHGSANWTAKSFKKSFEIISVTNTVDPFLLQWVDIVEASP